MYYYDLVRIFGSIPLITEPINLKSPELYPDQLRRRPRDKQIEADSDPKPKPRACLSPMPLAGPVWVPLNRCYPACILTMAGYPLQKKSTSKAADKAKEVIDSGKYSLFSSYDDRPSQKNKGENIFMQYAAFVLPSNWQSSIIPYNQLSAYRLTGDFVNKEFVSRTSN